MKHPIFWFIITFFLIAPCRIDGYLVNTEMVAMRDGVRLATDIYRPITSKPPWPVILMRTPYKRSSAMNGTVALIVCNFMHYTLVVQNTRGRFESEGIDSLYFSDGWGSVQDGYNTVQWIESQSWCNGKIGSFGASALGMTQYFMAGSAPPALDCCLVIVAASNLYEDALFYGGVYRESLVDGWLGGNDAEHLIDFFADHPVYNSMYDRLNLLNRLDSVSVPIMHVGGWHDIFVQGQINAFTGLQTQGGACARGRQKLIVGPWIHNITSEWTGDLRFPKSSAITWLGVMINWFDCYLKDDDCESIMDIPPVQYYLMGDPDLPEGPGNRWISSDFWPPDYQAIPLYFRAGGLLTLEPPGENETLDAFTYDPGYPVLTEGGRNLNIPAGSKDQYEAESRDDVLVYTTLPLEDSVIVTGPVSVTLYASSDAVDTDFSARLCDVYPDGRSMLVSDGIVRAKHRNSIREEDFLVPGAVTEFTIDLWSTAIALAPGHAIRIDITSSNSPRFAVNPNTGEPFRQETGQNIAHQTIHHSPLYPSALNLPVLSGIETRIANLSSVKPTTAQLDQNFPNPFNARTVIPVRLTEQPGPCFLIIIDVLGSTIQEWELTNMSGKVLIDWNGKNIYGQAVPTGVYFARLTQEKFQKTRKMVIIK